MDVVDTPDIDKFDDDLKWTLPDLVTASPLKDVEVDKVKILCDHERKIRRIEAIKKVLLAIVASIPVVLAMLR